MGEVSLNLLGQAKFLCRPICLPLATTQLITNYDLQPIAYLCLDYVRCEVIQALKLVNLLTRLGYELVACCKKLLLKEFFYFRI